MVVLMHFAYMYHMCTRVLFGVLQVEMGKNGHAEATWYPTGRCKVVRYW